MLIRKIQAFTLIELLVVISIIALLIGILLPALGAARRTANQMKNGTQLRGIHQSCIVFAAGNKTYLPGMNSSGEVLDTTDAAFGSLPGGQTTFNDHNGGEVVAAVSQTGAANGGGFNTRLYILLNGNYIAGDLILNPLDTPTGGKWTNTGALPVVPTSTSAGQFSYSLLNIVDTFASSPSRSRNSTVSAARFGEWRDNANSQAVLLCDRNSATTSTSPRSIWATSAGTITDWKGSLVWGDNHADFVTSSTGLTTKYLTTTDVADDLFSYNPQTAANGVDSAYFGYTSDNY